MNNKLSVQYSGLVQQLVETSNSVLKTKSTSDELITMRLRTKKNEIIIIPSTSKPPDLKHTNFRVLLI